jgi:plastocyanin
MTSRLRTFSKPGAVLALVAALVGVAAQAATVSGTVQLKDSGVEAVNKRRDYSGVVVSLQPVNQPPAPAARRAVVLQKNKTFTPHILTVVAGTTVDFPNSDPIFHNAFSSYSGQIFDVGLYPPGTARGGARVLQHPPLHERRHSGAEYSMVHDHREGRFLPAGRSAGYLRGERLPRTVHPKHTAEPDAADCGDRRAPENAGAHPGIRSGVPACAPQEQIR